MMSNTGFTLYEINEGAAWITLNRPENRNALSAVLVNELYAHLQNAITDDKVRCIVITGNGPAFCAGAEWIQRSKPLVRWPIIMKSSPIDCFKGESDCFE